MNDTNGKTSPQWSIGFRSSSFYKMHKTMKDLTAYMNEQSDVNEEHIEIMVSKIYYDNYDLRFSYDHIDNVPGVCQELKNNKDLIDELRNKIRGVIHSYKFSYNWEKNCKDLDEKLKKLSLTNETNEELSQELLHFFFRMPSPILWYEEGIAYRLLRDTEVGDLSEMFFIMDKANEQRERKTKTCYLNEPNREAESGSHPEILDVPSGYNDKRKFFYQWKKIKELFGIFLAIFGASHDKVGALNITDTLKGEEAYSKRHSFIVPIWQNYIFGRGYGGLWGFINIYVGDRSGKTLPCEYSDKIIEKLKTVVSKHISSYVIYLSNEFFLSYISTVSRTLARDISNKAKNKSTLIQKPSPVDLFMMQLKYMQSWKNVWVVDMDNNIVIQQWERQDKFFIQSYNKKRQRDFSQDWQNGACIRFKFDDIFFGKIKSEIKDEFASATHIIFQPSEVFSCPPDALRQIFEERLIEQQRSLVYRITHELERFEYAERLARSAIMARNMSHNIGSHVLTKVISGLLIDQKKSDDERKRQIDALKILLECPQITQEQLINLLSNDEIKKQPVLKTLSSNVSTQDLDNLLSNDEIKNQTLSDLLDYLQIRMDHLAEMATQRHYKKPTSLYWANIQKDFKDQKLLLKYISGAGQEKPLECEGTFRRWNKDTKKYVDNGVDGACVAVPNGGTGIHALYILIENFVRNVAKHNDISEGKEIRFYVDINDELYPDMIKVSLWQESITENSKKVKSAGKEESSKKDCDQVKYIREKINASLVGENFQPREHAWGLGEMLLSAQYLSQGNYPKSPLEVSWANKEGDDWADADGTKIDPNPSDDARIRYRFYMQKPREVAVVAGKNDEKCPTPEDNTQRTMMSCGVKWISVDEQSSLEDIISDAKNYRRIVWLLDKKLEELESNMFNDLPLRTFVAASCENTENHPVSIVKEDFICEVQDCFENESDLYSFLQYLDEKWCCFLTRRHGIEENDGFHLLNNDEGDTGLGRQYWKTPANSIKKILYHRHNINHEEQDLFQSIKENKNWKNDGNRFFVEVYTAQSNLGPAWESPPVDCKQLYEYEFASAALAKIVVLDERIQGDMEGYTISPDCVDPQWILVEGKNRIFVPAKKICPLDPQDNPCWKRIKEYIKQTHQGDPIDCIVVHLSILQKLEEINKESKSIDDFLDVLKWGKDGDEDDLYSETPPLSVRICTGRGSVQGHLDGSDGEIIPFSELKRWLSPSSPSKYHLCRLLDL